jgi:hypothetical protein
MRFFSFFLLATACFGWVSCSKLVDAPPPSDALTAEKIFATDADAGKALNGIILQMIYNARGPYNGNITVYPGLSADEISVTNPLNPEDSFHQPALTPGYLPNTNQYTGSYRIIYFINALLEGMAGSTGLSATKRAQLEGEAKFCRALIYFYLTNLYGEVPLVTGTLYTETALLHRSPVGTVYQLVTSDLQDAQRLLPAGYVTEDRTHPNQGAVLALLARVRLYQGEWSLAAAAAGPVIGDGQYRLENSLDSVFLAGSREAIWQLQPAYEQEFPVEKRWGVAEGALFLPKNNGATPAYVLSKSLLGAFETGDQRALHWIKTVVVQGVSYRFPYKYRQAVWTPAAPEYATILRLAELYLVRAEARARMGDREGALADLNIVRRRAGLADIPVTDDSDLIDWVLKERRVELMAEWGHRWFDLKRMGQAKNALYPIPASERQNNPNLTQNVGY